MSAVASPCINVCRMDETTALCQGCLRTLDEIRQWSRAGDDLKRTILAAVDKRRAERDPDGRGFRGDGNR